METREDHLLEIEQITLDPITTGFTGVILQITKEGDLFVYKEISLLSGNMIFTRTSASEELVRNLYQRELRAYEGLHPLLPEREEIRNITTDYDR